MILSLFWPSKNSIRYTCLNLIIVTLRKWGIYSFSKLWKIVIFAKNFEKSLAHLAVQTLADFSNFGHPKNGQCFADDCTLTGSNITVPWILWELILPFHFQYFRIDITILIFKILIWTNITVPPLHRLIHSFTAKSD